MSLHRSMRPTQLAPSLFIAWIFQVNGTLTIANTVQMILVGGARAANIFWAVNGAVTAGTTSHLEGVFLGKTGITLQTGATANSRLLAQTLVALQQVRRVFFACTCIISSHDFAPAGYCDCVTDVNPAGTIVTLILYKNRTIFCFRSCLYHAIKYTWPTLLASNSLFFVLRPIHTRVAHAPLNITSQQPDGT